MRACALAVAAAAVAAAAVAAVGCSAPTRVVADIAAAPFAPASLTLTVGGGLAPLVQPLVAGGQPLTLPARVTIDVADQARPLTLALHAAAADGRVADANGAVTTEPHHTLDVPLALTVTTACSGLAVAVCEDFESGAWDAATWLSQMGSGSSVTVDDAHAHDGRFALHVHTPAGVGGGADLDEIRFTARDAADLFVRLWVYLPALVGNGRLTSASQADAPFGGVDLYLEDDSIAAENKVSGNYHGGAGATLSAGRWSCVEQELVTSSPNALRAWVDGVLVIDAADATATAPPESAITVGLDFYDTQMRAATDLWIDDIAVDGSRIGCGS